MYRGETWAYESHAHGCGGDIMTEIVVRHEDFLDHTGVGHSQYPCVVDEDENSDY